MTHSSSPSIGHLGSIASQHVATTRALPRAVVYRRRRTVAGAIVVGIVTLLGLGIGDVLAGPGDVPASAAGAQPSAGQRTVVAMPGDSLWSIAETIYATEATDHSVSFQDYVEALIDLNGDVQIEVGQHVLLP